MTCLLVIDDEPDIHRVLTPVLTGAGWTVLGATTAAQGLRVARANTITVVLLDLGLPDVDGKEIIDQLQATNALSIIVISARHQDSKAARPSVMYQGASHGRTGPASSR